MRLTVTSPSMEQRWRNAGRRRMSEYIRRTMQERMEAAKAEWPVGREDARPPSATLFRIEGRDLRWSILNTADYLERIRARKYNGARPVDVLIEGPLRREVDNMRPAILDVIRSALG